MKPKSKREATPEEVLFFLELQAETRLRQTPNVKFGGRWATCHVIDMTKKSFRFRMRGAGWQVYYVNSAFVQSIITITGSEDNFHRDMIAYRLSK